MESKTGYELIKKIGGLTEDGVIIYNLTDREFIYANESFFKIFELHSDSLAQQANIVLQYILEEDLVYLQARFEELLATGCINTTEFRLNFPDNKIKHLSCDVLML